MTAPNHREEVKFEPNIPTIVALKYAHGKIVAGKFGERILFTTTDGRVFFVSPEVAGKIEEAGVNVREPFTLTQHWDGAKDSPRTWTVSRIPGEQRDGTLVVPKLPPAPEPTVTPKPPARATAANGETRRAEGAAHLIAESKAMIDAYADVLKHALETHGGRVKPDEVRAIFLTCAINACKARAA